MKNLVYMRTHFINDFVLSEYLKLSQISDKEYDTILFIDNHTNFIKTQNISPIQNILFNNFSVKCFLFNSNIYETLSLPLFTDNPNNYDLGQVMWYCSDYPFYIIRKFLPNYDFYWSIESDVFFNGKSYKAFFEKHKSNNSDLLIHDFRSFHDSNEIWHWNDCSEWVYTDITQYGGFFPVVRLSAKAADFLYNKRIEEKELFEKVKHIYPNRWIFCESFVPTELANNGFKCSNLDEENLKYQLHHSINIEELSKTPDNKMYHPIK